MIIDLHAHYPMHLHGEHAGLRLRRWSTMALEADLVNLISKGFNYQGPGDTPAVTMARIRAGGVKVVLSALYWPSDEIGPTADVTGEPNRGAPDRLLTQLDLVNRHVESKHAKVAQVVTNRVGLNAVIEGEKTGIVHCVEGGFALGDTVEEIKDTVGALAEKGVAYVTVAHLFFRDVATNAPALPFMRDERYHSVFPQPPAVGLTTLGKAVVGEMLEHGVVIDLTHMSRQSMTDTLDIVRATYKPGDIPVIVSHGACNLGGGLEYNLETDMIKAITELGGVIGLICATHYIAFGQEPQPRELAESVEAFCRHVNRIYQVTGDYDHIAIGSDLDGFIKPALPDLDTIDKLEHLEHGLSMAYGAEVAEKICFGNARRVLEYRFPDA